MKKSDPTVAATAANPRRLIADTIRSTGPIPFARFMELALYAPNCGYYEKELATVGRKGDFVTSVSTGALFGELLAFRFATWLEAFPQCQIVEAGAHSGQLAADILGWLAERRPQMLVEYWLIEPSPLRREWQRRTLAAFADRIRWFDDWSSVPTRSVHGVIFSNELLDAFPVHKLGWDATRREWLEWGVTLEGDRFEWTRLPLSSQALAPTIPAELASVLPDGFIVETSPAATKWWREAAGRLAAGHLLTFDYGITEEEQFQPERCAGTLRAYSRHRALNDLLAEPGERDITAHVNFSVVARVGEGAGLGDTTLLPQAQFLFGVAEAAMQPKSGFGEWTLEKRRQLQALLHPEHFGRAFRILDQSRRRIPRALPQCEF